MEKQSLLDRIVAKVSYDAGYLLGIGCALMVIFIYKMRQWMGLD